MDDLDHKRFAQGADLMLAMAWTRLAAMADGLEAMPDPAGLEGLLGGTGLAQGLWMAVEALLTMEPPCLKELSLDELREVVEASRSVARRFGGD